MFIWYFENGIILGWDKFTTLEDARKCAETYNQKNIRDGRYACLMFMEPYGE